MVWSTRLPVVAACLFVLCFFENASGRLIDDFSDGTDGGWTRHDFTEGTRYGPATFDASTNSYHIASSPSHAGHNAAADKLLLASWDPSADVPISDGFVRATTRADGRSAHLSVVIRGAADRHGRLSGYVAAVCSTDGRLFLLEVNGSSLNFLGTANAGFRPGQEWILEAGAVGDRISARAWRADRPDTVVTIRNRDRSLREGFVGVGASQHLNAASVFGGSFDDIQFVPPLKAGDADQDFDFDQFDLIQVQQAGKYLTGELATWGEGDWNGVPGGYPGSPPRGDGVFNQLDIVAAQQGAAYLTGSYEALRASAVATQIAMPEPATLPVFLVGGLLALACLGRSSLAGLPQYR